MSEYLCCSPLSLPASILNSVLRGHVETLACCGGLAPVAKRINNCGDTSVALVTGTCVVCCVCVCVCVYVCMSLSPLTDILLLPLPTTL